MWKFQYYITVIEITAGLRVLTSEIYHRKGCCDMLITAIFTFLHSVTPKFTPVTPKWIGIVSDANQVYVPSFELIALKPLELCSSDPKLIPWPQNWPQWPTNEEASCPTLYHQVDSSETFWVMIQWLQNWLIDPKIDPSGVLKKSLSTKKQFQTQLALKKRCWRPKQIF